MMKDTTRTLHHFVLVLCKTLGKTHWSLHRKTRKIFI